MRAKADTIASPLVARGYRNLVLDAGFVDPVVEVHTAVFTGESALLVISSLAPAATEPIDGWLAEQQARAARDRMFVAVPMFLVAARR